MLLVQSECLVMPYGEQACQNTFFFRSENREMLEARLYVVDALLNDNREQPQKHVFIM